MSSRLLLNPLGSLFYLYKVIYLYPCFLYLKFRIEKKSHISATSFHNMQSHDVFQKGKKKLPLIKLKVTHMSVGKCLLC